MLFKVRSCKPVKRLERLDEESLFLLLGEAQCTEEGRGVALSRKILNLELIYFIYVVSETARGR